MNERSASTAIPVRDERLRGRSGKEEGSPPGLKRVMYPVAKRCEIGVYCSPGIERVRNVAVPPTRGSESPPPNEAWQPASTLTSRNRCAKNSMTCRPGGPDRERPACAANASTAVPQTAQAVREVDGGSPAFKETAEGFWTRGGTLGKSGGRRKYKPAGAGAQMGRPGIEPGTNGLKGRCSAWLS